jgi:type I restriction enzyme R subunit
VLQDDITKTLVQQNEEKYRLLRDGVPVKVRDARQAGWWTRRLR